MGETSSSDASTDEELLRVLRGLATTSGSGSRDSRTTPPSARPPATVDMVVTAEAQLGFPLPPFLKRIYTEVANGGFGPGYGLAGLTGGHGDSEGRSLPKLYEKLVSGSWPRDLLPLWDWGDSIWSCVDRTRPEETIVTHDDVEGPTVTDFTIRSWLRAWANGVDLWNEIYEDKEATVMNPFTRKPTVTKVRGRAKGRKN